jgi:hypothetical protein
VLLPLPLAPISTTSAPGGTSSETDAARAVADVDAQVAHLQQEGFMGFL